jgi:hypothetical protein
MNKEIEIVWPEWKDLINEKFIPLVDNKDRYIICYGGRGSGKSDAIAKILIYRCLNEKYFRFLLIRREYSTIRESSYQTIKDIILELGLESLFEFHTSPLEIICRVNGNRFIARGCDDVTKLKSVKDPSGAYYEEDIPTESDFITITTSIRTSKAEYLTEYFTINPECDGDHTLHWFWQRFFSGNSELSFRSSVPMQISSNTTVDMTYTVHHSTYLDNRWITPQMIAFLQDLKQKNPYYYQVYCLGRWGHRETTGQFIKQFRIGKNVMPTEYNPARPLWCSFDFNVLPGVSCVIAQHENGLLQIIDELQLAPPKNNTVAVCREILNRYGNHHGGMYITGDASGRHEDTRTEKGFNDYSIILGELSAFGPSNHTPRINPPVKPRRDFIDSVFQSGDKGHRGLRINIDPKCGKLINDLLYSQEASDGTMLKQRVKDHKTGASYERYGHLLDAMTYAVCTMAANAFETDKRGGFSGKIILGQRNQRPATSGWPDNY